MKYEHTLHEPNKTAETRGSKHYSVKLRLFITRCTMVVLCYVLITSDAGRTAFHHMSEHRHINSVDEIKKDFYKALGF
jgi:hypothetical protein